MSDTRELPAVVDDPPRLAYTPTVLARFRGVIAAEIARVEQQAHHEVAQLRQMLADVEQGVPAARGRDPYANAPEWAEDSRVAHGVERLTAAVESHRKTGDGEGCA